jgi:heme-degrading monooxygenase HmoA
MYVAFTDVQLQPDRIDTVRELFEETNPGLVADQDDWISAKFTADYDTDRVTVMAFWRDANAYRSFSESKHFRKVMSQFAPHFAAPPEVRIHEVLYEM